MPRLTAFRRRRSSIVGQPRQPQLAPSHAVVAVARVVDGVDDDTSTPSGWIRSATWLEPAQERVREVAVEQVVAAGGERDDVRRRRCASEVGERTARRVAVAGEVDESYAELARELRPRSPPDTPV